MVDISKKHPKNEEYPEIVTETETTERSESTEESNLVYKTGQPKGTVLVKKTSVIETKIRTTTPYHGTL